MDEDTFIYTPAPEPPARRSFGGLGRLPAALLVAGGLMVGGGVGGFVIASAASTPSPSVSPSPSSGTTPGTPSHHCPHRGGTSGSSASSSPLY